MGKPLVVGSRDWWVQTSQRRGGNCGLWWYAKLCWKFWALLRWRNGSGESQGPYDRALSTLIEKKASRSDSDSFALGVIIRDIESRYQLFMICLRSISASGELSKIYIHCLSDCTAYTFHLLDEVIWTRVREQHWRSSPTIIYRRNEYIDI